MMAVSTQGLSTGLKGLDAALRGILAGDNIVWQIDSIDDYRAFVTPYCEAALRAEKKLIYFRFADHEQLLADDFGAAIHHINPKDGFETFVAQVHGVIAEAGWGAFYVFDCLSGLAVEWRSDQMLGNFFMLTCPYLFDLETVTYFALYRNLHTPNALGPISNTTQLFLDTYSHKDILYVRPIKVQQRYSPTMNMLHAWRGDDFVPVTSSAIIAEILTSSQWSGLDSDRSLGFWESAFNEAEQRVSGRICPDCSSEDVRDHFERLAQMVVSRDESMLRLISKFMKLEDILEIKKRLIGTGLIGGKAVGMLLARAILKRNERLASLLEAHDSFFIGSDVFYTFLVTNGLWFDRQKQRDPATFLEGAEKARRRILTGTFPDYIIRQLEEVLDYYGQSSFIVRSSSLLEDNFGNAFAGKYQSVFCVNQGPRHRRMEDFVSAIKTIYASSMSESALRYRAQKGILDRDEQMSLLIMRVSGEAYGDSFYPQMAGVGFSFNPYVWSKEIDPEAGVIRLVYGLGTRAVDRSDDDYTRVVALNVPEKRPETNFDEIVQYAQRKVDYLALSANQLVTGDFQKLLSEASKAVPLDLFTSVETQRGDQRGGYRVLTFDRLLKDTKFVEDMREILRDISTGYDHPVDIEFTANFISEEAYRINIVQCRPLQIHGTDSTELPKIEAPRKDRIISAHGAVVGHSRYSVVDRFVYVVPEEYGKLPAGDRYEVANLLGEINAVEGSQTTMLLGPGRWGTSTPQLGVPVNFVQISHTSILCEIVAMHETLVPDVSLGTHFLNELVEMDMLYLALFPDQGDNYLNRAFFMESPSVLPDIVPSAERWKDVVRVIDVRKMGDICRPVAFVANAREQTVNCFFER
ncbi:MAG: PEP/pyruvate-binding domain-containing protein [Verrucomicrobia bacterium]|nr:PEP/pyruvate-binding domain-containing protein [Verrucomicrobiota bacterium]